MATDNALDIVPTRASRVNDASANFKAIVFESHKAKARKSATAGIVAKKSDDSEFDMKKIRHEVFNFGISGYEFEDQQKAKMALAVKLGAKPPKGVNKNYKELIDERKQAKAKAAEEAYIRTVGKNSSGRATVSCNKLVNRFTKEKRRAKDVTNITQHYGVVNPNVAKKKRKRK